jgi:uncharacterized protein (TIGR01244 family)
MKKSLYFSIAALLSAALLGTPAANAQKFVRQESVRALPSPVLLETAGLFQDRYAKVGEDIFIAGQPTERALREMKAQGVTTIVNLRTPTEMARIGFDEEKLIAELGMKYVYLPVRGDAEFPYSTETLKQFTQEMQSAEGKVLLHCTVAWRASHLWGAYLIQAGVPAADMLKHTRAINLMDDHRMDSSGRQPIELFLGRPVAGLGNPPD